MPSLSAIWMVTEPVGKATSEACSTEQNCKKENQWWDTVLEEAASFRWAGKQTSWLIVAVRDSADIYSQSQSGSTITSPLSPTAVCEWHLVTSIHVIITKIWSKSLSSPGECRLNRTRTSSSRDAPHWRNFASWGIIISQNVSIIYQPIREGQSHMAKPAPGRTGESFPNATQTDRDMNKLFFYQCEVPSEVYYYWFY